MISVNIDAIISHPAAIAIGRIIQFILAVVTAVAGLTVGSFLGFISVCGIMMTIGKAPDMNMLTGAMCFAGVIAGALLVGCSLLGLARLAWRVFGNEDIAVLFNALKAKN